MITYPIPTPLWLTEAFKHIGLSEIPGKNHNPTITNWLIELKAWWKDDETAWCGTFIAYCLKTAGITPPKNWYRAKDYSNYGSPCNKDSIPFGAICVKSRVGGGHVFFAVAESRDGNTIYGLGGNQGNKVCIVPFNLSDIESVVFPPVTIKRLALPIAASLADVGGVSAGSEA